MKKLLIVVATLVLSLSLTSCSSKLQEARIVKLENELSQLASENEILRATIPTAPVLDKEIDSGSNKASNDTTFDGTTYTNKDWTIKITSMDIVTGQEAIDIGIAPKNDHPAYALFRCDITLNAEGLDPVESTPFWIWDSSFMLYQDTDPNFTIPLHTTSVSAFTPDDYVPDNQYVAINPGGTVSSYMLYELTDDTTPLRLVATADLFGEAITEKMIPITE
ncbi:MAG: DUF5067 domain-containing protein [Fastidiosipilaceae bacterium]|jgi:hypothetical protein